MVLYSFLLFFFILRVPSDRVFFFNESQLPFSRFYWAANILPTTNALPGLGLLEDCPDLPVLFFPVG